MCNVSVGNGDWLLVLYKNEIHFRIFFFFIARYNRSRLQGSPNKALDIGEMYVEGLTIEKG